MVIPPFFCFEGTVYDVTNLACGVAHFQAECLAHYSPVRVAHIAPESLAHFTPVEVAHYAPVCSIGEEKFVEVYLSASLDTCEKRDTKGLYCKARAGELPGFTGISSPYEPPENADQIIGTPTHSLSKPVSNCFLACVVVAWLDH